MVFDPVDGGNALEFQQQYGNVTIANCKFVAEENAADFFVNKGTQWITTNVDFEACEFTGGYISPSTIAGSEGISFADCDFTNVKINLQNGYNYEFDGCEFNYPFANDGLSYAIRSNDQAVALNGCTFDVDVADDFVAKEGDFGILWARQAGSTKWDVKDITVNYTEKAMAAVQNDANFVFVNNGTTDPNNAGDRIIISNVKSEDNDAEALSQILASSAGVINLIYSDNLQIIISRKGSDFLNNFGIVPIDVQSVPYHLFAFFVL